MQDHMEPAQAVARLIQGVEKAYARKWPFLGLFLLIFFVSFSILLATDVVPNSAEPQTAEANVAPEVTLATSPLVASAGTAAVIGASAGVTGHAASAMVIPQSGELPVKITIPSIGLSAFVSNPDTTDVDALDATLLKGAARYPTSATLGENGNVILFGHSSYLPIVNNQAYKTFDGIQKLKAGDRITVYSSGTAYEYAVETVAKESAASDYAIPLAVQGRKLTLSTCNSFGTKSDRFVVTANFVDSYPLGT